MNDYTSSQCTILWQERAATALPKAWWRGRKLDVNMKKSFCLNTITCLEYSTLRWSLRSEDKDKLKRVCLLKDCFFKSLKRI